MIIPKRKIRYPIAIEREYAKLLVAYVKAEYEIIESFIPEMTDALIRNAIKQDAIGDWLGAIVDKVKRKVESKISPTKIINKIFGRVNKHVEREHSEIIKSVFGSEPRVEKNNRQFEMLKTVWTAENMTLIKSIDSQTMDKIRFTLSQKIIATANREMLMSDLTKEIRQLAGVSETRAALIGADQVGKLNGRLTQYRQMSAGIESYIWRTMGDRRVRPNHATRSGLVFKWSNPPDGGHPGQAVRCRCVAQPLIDEQSFKLVPIQGSYTFARPKNLAGNGVKSTNSLINTPENTIINNNNSPTNFEDFKNYWKSKYGVEVADSFAKLDFKIVNEASRGIEKVIGEFSKAKKCLKSLDAGNLIEWGFGDAYMAAIYEEDINFDIRYFSNFELFSKTLKEDLKNHYHPANTTFYGVGAHEMGHILEKALIVKNKGGMHEWNTCVYAQKVVREAANIVQATPTGRVRVKNYKGEEMIRKRPITQLRREISVYAGENYSETLAEAVCDYVTNEENARPLSKEIWKILKRELN